MTNAILQVRCQFQQCKPFYQWLGSEAFWSSQDLDTIVSGNGSLLEAF